MWSIKRTSLFRHHISNQFLLARPIPAALLLPPAPPQDGRHSAIQFANLNAEAANLHLMIGSSPEFQSSIGQTAGEIACSIKTRSGFIAERIRNKLSAVITGWFRYPRATLGPPM